MTTLSQRNTLVVPERPSPWDAVQLDLDLNEYDPFNDTPPYINSLFEALVQTPRTLLDKFKLPTDSGAAVAQAITAGTAVAVSDGFYDDSRQAGSSDFIIAPNKDKGGVCLEGANFISTKSSLVREPSSTGSIPTNCDIDWKASRTAAKNDSWPAALQSQIFLWMDQCWQ